MEPLLACGIPYGELELNTVDVKLLGEKGRLYGRLLVVPEGVLAVPDDQ